MKIEELAHLSITIQQVRDLLNSSHIPKNKLIALRKSYSFLENEFILKVSQFSSVEPPHPVTLASESASVPYVVIDPEAREKADAEKRNQIPRKLTNKVKGEKLA